LKGRRSEEPPDNFAYKAKLIDNSGARNDNATPESGYAGIPEKSRNANANIISSHPSANDQANHPVQNIMKIGNLFLFNVYKNNEENTTAESVQKVAQNLMRATPVANIELDPLEFGQSNVNDIAVEGHTCLENKLRDPSRVSPTFEMTKHMLARKAKISLKSPENNFIDQMHKRINKNTNMRGNKLASTYGKNNNLGAAKRNKPSPRRSNKISLSNSPVHNFGKKHEY
jgi:hypothetical protein